MLLICIFEGNIFDAGRITATPRHHKNTIVRRLPSFTEFFFSTPRMHLSSVSRRMSNQTQLYRVLLGFLDSGFASKFASFFIDFLDRIE